MLPTTNPKLWRKLKPGDRVRLVHIHEFEQPGYAIFPETLRVYRKLLKRRRPMRVSRIDEYGHPWVVVRFRKQNGTFESHWLALNHDGLERVHPRP